MAHEFIAALNSYSIIALNKHLADGKYQIFRVDRNRIKSNLVSFTVHGMAFGGKPVYGEVLRVHVCCDSRTAEQ